MTCRGSECLQWLGGCGNGGGCSTFVLRGNGEAGRYWCRSVKCWSGSTWKHRNHLNWGFWLAIQYECSRCVSLAQAYPAPHEGMYWTLNLAPWPSCIWRCKSNTPSYGVNHVPFEDFFLQVILLMVAGTEVWADSCDQQCSGGTGCSWKVYLQCYQTCAPRSGWRSPGRVTGNWCEGCNSTSRGHCNRMVSSQISCGCMVS